MSLNFNLRYVLVIGLFFIWSVPHTISLRYIISTLLLATCIPLIRADSLKSIFRPDDPVTKLWIILLTLTGWIIFQATLISPEPYWSLKEIRGQWDTTIVFALLGTLIGRNQREGKAISQAMILTLFVITSFYVIDALNDWRISGELTTRRPGMHGSPYEQSLLAAILMAFLLGDLYGRLVTKTKRILSTPLSGLILMIAVTTFSVYLTRIRLGVLGLTALLIAAGAILYIRKKSKLVITISATLALLAVSLFTFHVIDDKRWSTLISTIQVATEDNRDEWKGSPSTTKQVTQTDGKIADASNYLRMAYAYNGLKIISEHPLGVGFGRNAFGHQVARDNPELEIEDVGFHSHSGIIDWTIGTGIPGLILWLSLLGYALMFAIRMGFHRSGSPLGVTLALLITSSIYRSIVDSTLRDHYIQITLFLIFFLASHMTNTKRNRINNPGLSENEKP